MESRQATFLRGASLLSVLTLVSRVLGLVRESVCAYCFGVGAIWDDFMLAFSIPNLSRRLFGEGALSTAFVPVFADKVSGGRQDEARLFLGRLITVLAALLCALVVIGELILLVLGRWLPEGLIQLTAIMLPYTVFICAVAVLAGAHNVHGRFTAAAFSPIFFNLFFIACAVLAVTAAPELGFDLERAAGWLAAGVVAGGACQVVLQWLALRRVQCTPLLSWGPRDPDIAAVVRIMGPMVLGLSAVQLNTLGDMVVARVFVEQAGSVSSLSYAARLYQLPVGVFGAALATAILPGLSRLASAGDHDGFALMVQRGMRLALFVGVPATLGLCLVRQELVTVLFEHGRFDADDTARVARVTWAYGLGIWAYIGQQVLVRAYYAQRDAKTPMKIATAMVAVNLALNLLLVHWMQEAGVALGTALCAVLQLMILVRMYPARVGPLDLDALRRGMLRSAAACAAMLAVILVARKAMHLAHAGTAALLIAEVTAGTAVYAGTAWLGRFPEVEEVRAAWRRRPAAAVS